MILGIRHLICDVICILYIALWWRCPSLLAKYPAPRTPHARCAARRHPLAPRCDYGQLQAWAQWLVHTTERNKHGWWFQWTKYETLWNAYETLQSVGWMHCGTTNSKKQCKLERKRQNTLGIRKNTYNYPEHLNPTNLSGLKTNLGFSRDIRENLGFLTKSSCFAPKPSIAMCRCSIFIFSRRLIKFSVVKTCFTICL